MDSTHEQQASEAELLKAVAKGDHSAFERLYQYYEKRVFHYVRLFVREQALAEDVVAEVMVSVWRGACTFAHHSRVSTWIFGIARHKALDALRKTGRHDRDGIPFEDAGEIPSGCESPMEQAHRVEIGALTRRALMALSLEHREVLRLVFYEELAYEDIARMLGIPENTVKTRVFYAKQHLKKELDRLLQRTHS